MVEPLVIRVDRSVLVVGRETSRAGWKCDVSAARTVKAQTSICARRLASTRSAQIHRSRAHRGRATPAAAFLTFRIVVASLTRRQATGEHTETFCRHGWTVRPCTCERAQAGKDAAPILSRYSSDARCCCDGIVLQTPARYEGNPLTQQLGRAIFKLACTLLRALRN